MLAIGATTTIAEDASGSVLQLSWDAPHECADAAVLREKVENQLGYRLDEAATEVLSANAVVVADGGRFRLQLRTQFRGEARTRQLEGGSCENVVNATALMLAFLLDPEAAAAHTVPSDAATDVPSEGSAIPNEPRDAAQPVVAAPSPAVAPRESPKPVSVAIATTPRDAATDASRETRRKQPWFLGASAGVDSGALPEATSTASLFLGRRFGPAQLEASALRLWPQERRLVGDSARGGRFELWGLAFSGCYAPASGKLELGPCVGIESGTVYGSGFGIDVPRQGKGLWLAALGMLGARYRVLPWFGARLHAGVALPFTRPTYVLDNVGTVYRANFIALRGGLAAEAYF